MSVLELRGVSKTYGTGAAEVHALREVDLTVEAGTMVAVMGPSGSGKSTLLTIAGSLEEPTSGDVIIGGAALARMGRNDRARLRRRMVGYVFQDYNLLPGLTAAENTALPLELDGTPARRARAAAGKALEEFGIGEKAGSFPEQLSGGERQRVAIARALVNRPPLLLADEPTGALDTATGEEIGDLLVGLNASGQTLILVTHNPDLAARYASRTVQLVDGRITSDVTSPVLTGARR